MYVCLRRQMYHEIQHGYMGKHFRLRSGLDRGNAMPLEWPAIRVAAPFACRV